VKQLLFVFILILVLVKPVQAQSSILNGINPNDVFELIIQYNDGQDYHHYKFVEGENSICDVSRPENIRTCNINLSGYISLWAKIPIYQYIENMPDSINWNAWNWDTFSSDLGGYTPVVVAMEIRAYDPETDRAKRYWFSASFDPANPYQAAGLVSNRIDHFNYILVDAVLLQQMVGSTPESF
jgi:hypothetical protein